MAARRRDEEHLLVLFLGSTIGNFERPAAVAVPARVRQILRTGDSLLLGTDLEKPVAQLLAAYDDPLGITAAFNLNLLARINRELDADFDAAAVPPSRPLQRRRAQHRDAPALDLRADRHPARGRLAVTLHEDETIWTESCHKYAPEEVSRLAAARRFSLRGAVARPGVAVRAESLDRGLNGAAGMVQPVMRC